MDGAHGGPERKERLQALARTGNEYGGSLRLQPGLQPVGLSRPFFWLYRNYHRVETFGIEKVPKGRVLLISNHLGQLPMDGAMIGVALLLEAGPAAPSAAWWRSGCPRCPTSPPSWPGWGRSSAPRRTAGACWRPTRASSSPRACAARASSGPSATSSRTSAWAPRGPGDGHPHHRPHRRGGRRGAVPRPGGHQAPGQAARLPLFPLTVTGMPLPLPTKYRIYFGDPLRFTGRADDEDRAGQEGPHREDRHPGHAQPGTQGAPGRLLVTRPAPAP